MSLAKEKWYEVQTPSFVILSNAGEKYAYEAAMRLEEFQTVVQAVMPTFKFSTCAPTVVVAACDEETLKQLMPEFWLGQRRTQTDQG